MLFIAKSQYSMTCRFFSTKLFEADKSRCSVDALSRHSSVSSFPLLFLWKVKKKIHFSCSVGFLCSSLLALVSVDLQFSEFCTLSLYFDICLAQVYHFRRKELENLYFRLNSRLLLEYITSLYLHTCIRATDLQKLLLAIINKTMVHFYQM